MWHAEAKAPDDVVLDAAHDRDTACTQTEVPQLKKSSAMTTCFHVELVDTEDLHVNLFSKGLILLVLLIVW